ncbi:hypothetical protein [Desulfosporosinus lacus]|uniref:Uncharacterized protein n=1 Tax=Desulfosporosinus lacus DSM 15449 TaxID=1121420 RepID=A0A1M6D2B7_9FIRM|nr:hypothetical protein [Desulfosporosinus lacus]SHI67407.1 hypothetical protein SAMN02746098_04458 [Desulfosporosinus lacus DSM 15449]
MFPLNNCLNSTSKPRIQIPQPSLNQTPGTLEVEHCSLVYTSELDEGLIKESNWHIGSSEKLIEAKSESTVKKLPNLIKFDNLGTVRNISLRAKIETEKDSSSNNQVNVFYRYLINKPEAVPHLKVIYKGPAT